MSSEDRVKQSLPMSRCRTLVILALLAGLCAASGLLLSVFAAMTDNTLWNNNHWGIGKCNLVRTAGALNFCRRSQALAHGCLNLGAWYGCHEVWNTQALDAAEVTFRFWLRGDAYVVFFVKADADTFAGIRFSLSRAHNSAALQYDGTGRFLQRSGILNNGLMPWRWYQARFVFGQDGPSGYLNGEPILMPPWFSRSAPLIGFRSGLPAVYIDDVRITCRSGATFEEKFSRYPLLATHARIFGASMAAGLLVIYLVIRATRCGPRKAMHGALIAAIAVAAILIPVGGGWAWSQTTQYRSDTPPKRFREQMTALMVNKVSTQYGKNGDGRLLVSPRSSRKRILFLGDSQTYGVGARNRSECFPALIEKALNSKAASAAGGNEHAQDAAFECLNCSMLARDSTDILAAYEDHWIDYAPSLCVVNLSNNDPDEKQLGLNLEAIARLNRARGITTLFVIEPRSPEAVDDPGLTRRGDNIRHIAQEFNIKVIDAHAFLTLQQDTGFLWWDSGHLTSYGHALMAEALLPDIRAALAPSANKGKPSTNKESEHGDNDASPNPIPSPR